MTVPLNLNKYRNWSFYDSNKIKTAYTEKMAPIIMAANGGHKDPINRVRIFYTVFLENKRRTDVPNICTVVDKFFCDVLVKLKVVTDDSYKESPQSIYQFGGYDKENPRVVIEVLEIDPDRVFLPFFENPLQDTSEYED